MEAVIWRRKKQELYGFGVGFFPARLSAHGEAENEHVLVGILGRTKVGVSMVTPASTASTESSDIDP